MTDTKTWQTPSLTQKGAWLARINAAETACHYSPEETMLDAASLSFYPGGHLLRVVKNIPAAAPVYYIALPVDMIPMDGSLANIHAASAQAPLTLAEDTVIDYLRFRLYFGDQAVLHDARAGRYADGWKASVRLSDTTGVYDATLLVNTRGQVTEEQKEKRGDTALSFLPPFTL